MPKPLVNFLQLLTETTPLDGSVKINKNYLMPIYIGRIYKDDAVCEAFNMKVCHILL